MSISDLFARGGIAMWPLLFLSFLTLSTIIERAWFWSKILTREREISGRVLEAARRDWDAATEIARKSSSQPIGRFLYSALELQDPDPEVFELTLQASADEELNAMRRGDKVLESTIAIAPLLGLLGTVLGLISSLSSIRIGDLGTDAAAGVGLGISEALISTASGLIVAITALAFYRLFQSFIFSQAKLFRQAGNELELMYRKERLPLVRRNYGAASNPNAASGINSESTQSSSSNSSSGNSSSGNSSSGIAAPSSAEEKA